MNVHRLSRHAAIACVLAASASAWAAGPQRPQIPGFLDARTGQFTAQAAVAPQADLDPLAVGTYGGLLALRINITNKTSIPADWVIYCTQYVTVVDPAGTVITNQKTVKATRTGSTAACVPNINYSWVINNTNAIVTTQYMVFTQGDSTVLSDVNVNGNLPNIAVPANGQTTSRTVAVTL